MRTSQFPLAALLLLSQDPVDQTAWLGGCWLRQQGNLVSEEQWMAPRNGTMLGMSRTHRGPRLVGYEMMLIAPDSTGVLTYHAHPSGQPDAIFRATHASDTMVVFENPAHDFPTRIGYRRLGADSVVAWISGMVNGKERRGEFPYVRVACGN